MTPVRVVAPDATDVTLEIDDGGVVTSMALRRDGDEWIGEVPDGARYGLRADGPGRRFDASKVLLDPRATEVWFPPAHDRDIARRHGVDNAGRAPLAVARAERAPVPPQWSSRAPVVYEVHVDGFTRRLPGPHAGTFRGLADQLPRLVALGVSVVELMPVHQSDPLEGSYWGYMPLAFGAVEQRYATDGLDAADELAELVSTAHAHDIEIWLDVVFNHTTEVDEHGPTYSLRGLADAASYRLDEHGDYIETTGCGNDIDVTSPVARDLIVWSLDRLADLGVDGFRFDLAPVLSHDETFVAELDAWAGQRGVRLIAEPWDAAGRYQLGREWPGRGWGQWNDRFRDDVRGFLRGDDGLVPALQQRVQGSPDLFDAPLESVNFVSCHDGFTLYDVFAYDAKRNDANGQDGADGTDDDRSWNCGWEGDHGAPADVLALRRRQLRNAWCVLALSHGVPMFAAGDEFGRTQGGNNNAYNQDNETSWVDWDRRRDFADLERFVALLLALRHRHPVLSQPSFWRDDVEWFGVDGGPDLELGSHSLAWVVGDLCVLVNAWWEPLTFALQRPGPWRRTVDTDLPSPDDIVAGADRAIEVDGAYAVAARSVVVLERRA